MFDWLKLIVRAIICMLPCIILWEILMKEPFWWKGFIIIETASILGQIYYFWIMHI